MKKFSALAAVAAAVLLAGCSTPSSQGANSNDASGAPSSGSAGGSQPKPTVKSVKDLKVAYFSAGSSDSYLQAAISEAKSYAAQEGFSLDVFDGKFDAQTQFNQMQTALTSGNYNAFAVEPNDGNLVCNLLTKQAPAAHVMVSVFNLPICGRATALGVNTWEPGTVTYVGGQTPDVYDRWVAQVKKDYPKGAKIALISGPDLNANTAVFFQAAKAFKASDGYDVVAKQTTDYGTQEAFSAAQTIMQSHPDLNVIMSNYSGMTRGIVQATAKSKVAVYDFGGDQWAIDHVKSGELADTIIMLPKQETKQALEALVNLVQGKPVPKFINLTKLSVIPNQDPFVTKQNASQYTAEY